MLWIVTRGDAYLTGVAPPSASIRHLSRETMAYRIKLNEPADRAYRRIVGEQIERSLEQLRSAEDRVTAVHETRKAMKRVRALAKLMRAGMGDAVYRAENERYRDIARLLAGARDVDVLRATSTRLAHRQPKPVRAAAELIVERAAAAATTGDHTPHVAEAIAALEAAATACDEVRFGGRGFDAVQSGLERTYRAGRRRMEAAYRSGADEAFHDLRKDVQAHWRHMVVLEAVWPDLMQARAKLAKEVAELLGEDHDLFVLIVSARTAMSQTDATSGFEVLIEAAQRRQSDIRRELHAKGEALYAESPGTFTELIGRYWAAARAARKAERAASAEHEKADKEDKADKADTSRKTAGERRTTDTAAIEKADAPPADAAAPALAAAGGRPPRNRTRPGAQAKAGRATAKPATPRRR